MARSKRHRLWTVSTASQTGASLAAGATYAVDTFLGLEADMDPHAITVERVIGHWIAHSLSAAGANLENIMMGLVVGPKDSAPPVDPFNDPFASWLYHDGMYVVGEATTQPVSLPREHSFDVKGMRKIKAREETLWLIAHNPSTQIIHNYWYWRCLVTWA